MQLRQEAGEEEASMATKQRVRASSRVTTGKGEQQGDEAAAGALTLTLMP